MRSFVLLALLVSVFTFELASATRAQAQNFNVSAFNTLNYTINGQDDPALTLTRGTTYTFSVNSPGHPFYIKTQAGAGTANQFTNGVTGNGVEIGTLTFAVPVSAPNQLFYQCSAHSAMSGSIAIVNAASVPASNNWSNALLCGLLTLAFCMHQRVRRQRG